MHKTIIVSNRLPVSVNRQNKSLVYNESIGGLATGLKSVYRQDGGLWVGWFGMPSDTLNEAESDEISCKLKEQYQCVPVFLSRKELNRFYFGFCNKTIWPLFHYFQSQTKYSEKNWIAYQRVNEKFLDVLSGVIEDGDTVWIHDYQLMLLPQLLRKRYPNIKIGYFHHIPFPSSEIFRLMIWREALIKGLLGADLIGFHTYDYARHFLSCTRRLLGLEASLNHVLYEGRSVQIDVFPMGIDYEWFAKERTDAVFLDKIRRLQASANGIKTVLSIDRLDYTKGIPERIRAFGLFLSLYPEYRGKVRMNLIVAPSRVEVDSYEALRKEITELVSEVNGKYASLDWMPIWFYFKSFPQESLLAFYKTADVLLVTPLRDGMNLVAKEYIAARIDCSGMLVISETAGAASELGEAVIVNPNDYNAIANGIKMALELSLEEKLTRNRIMHKRLRRYNVTTWAHEFLRALNEGGQDDKSLAEVLPLEKNSDALTAAYCSARQRIIFLDYDGTLVGFRSLPEQATPDDDLYSLLNGLSSDPKNTVVIISGRDKDFLEKWFGSLNVCLVAAHGLWLRRPQQEWVMTVSLDNEWKSYVRKLLDLYADRVPGSFIEEKEYSLAWHYRQSDPDLLALRLVEIREALLGMTQTMTLEIQEGNKVLEVKDSRVTKGFGASLLLQGNQPDFLFAIGDDLTDESLFAALPQNAYTVKVGVGQSCAHYRLNSWQDTRSFLRLLVEKHHAQKALRSRHKRLSPSQN